jgi:hypothetical protein
MTNATSALRTPREPELLGQTVVVIGGSSGIGLETARRASAEGAQLILTARDPERLHRVGVELGARTDEVLKVIVANPTMIKAYKAGIPGNGRPFPEGSRIAKLQWSFKKSTEAPFAVDVPNAFTQAFVIEKDSKRFPKSGGWGYALFNYDAASDKFTADPSPSDCGHACHVAVKAKDFIFHPYQKR